MLTDRNLGILRLTMLVALCVLAALSIASYEGAPLHGWAFLALYGVSMLAVIVGVFTAALGLWRIQKAGRPVFDSATTLERVVWIGGSLAFFAIMVLALANVDAVWSQAFRPLMTGFLAVPTLAQISAIRRRLAETGSTVPAGAA